jgi:flagellar biosynthesis protein
MRHGDPNTPRAAALHHDPLDGRAPRIVAAGDGDTAARIAALARESGVPIVADPDLVQLLAAVDVGQEIPEELFDAVAHLVAFLYRLNGERLEARDADAA